MQSAILLSVLLSLSLVHSWITPSGNYTPSIVECPTNHQFVRPASTGLNKDETAWLKTRKSISGQALKDYLCLVNISGFDSESWYNAVKDDANQVPTLALTFSGGGTRSQIAGYGIYQGLDARYGPANEAGTGGLLQALTYITGLSGGAVGATTLAISEFPTIERFVQAGNVNASAPAEAFESLLGKAQLGLPVTFADVLAVLQSYHGLVNVNNPIVNPFSWTFSGIRYQDGFKNGTYPMFILMYDDIVPEGAGSVSVQTYNGTILLGNPNGTTYYEMTPFEFGSWTGRVKAFTDLEYWGTTLQNGQPVGNKCIQGYDNAAFCQGTAVDALNMWLAEDDTNGADGQFAKRSKPYPANEDTIEQMRVARSSTPLVEALPEILELFHANLSDILYPLIVNSFANYTDGVESSLAQQEYLIVGDGSEGGQENPLWPVIQPTRKADLVIVSDAGGTELSTGWANGTNFINTAKAAALAGLPFPKVPSVNTMLNLNYTSQPTFFGCNEPDVPLILYVADYPYTAYGNISFTDNTLTPDQVALIVNNGVASISQDGGRLAENWPQCVACGSIYRSLERLGWDIPEVCQQCMKDYCWQGQVDDSSPSFLDPPLKLNSSLSYAVWNATVFF